MIHIFSFSILSHSENEHFQKCDITLLDVNYTYIKFTCDVILALIVILSVIS